MTWRRFMSVDVHGRDSLIRACLLLWLAALGWPGAATAVGGVWQDLPATLWQGNTKLEAPALKRQCAAVVAYPGKESAPLVCATAAPQPPGLYEVRLTLRPAHVANAIAFNSSVRVMVGEATAAEFAGQFFARVHQPETRVLQVVQPSLPKAGPLVLRLSAAADAGVCEQYYTAAKLKAGGPKLSGDLAGKGEEDDLGGELEVTLAPEKAVYYIVDRVECRPLSHTGQVVQVTVDKIRYQPGETLKGNVVVADVGGRGGAGTLNLYLEHGVQDRVKVKALPVTLAAAPQTLAFTVPLPTVELGYALVAEFVSADGADRSTAAEYFTIAANFARVALFGAGAGRGKDSEEATRRSLLKCKADYANAGEMFAWAEEDMVEMSPETDYWFSGQTCYHLKKAGLQQLIRLSHEYGIAQVSYAKFIMSGYLGWKTAYDFPNDHRGQYFYPTGMWEGVDVPTLDRFRNKEFIIYENTPGRIGDNPFYVWWASFMPINPDPTPRMACVAAEEVARSAEMFGWDGIRWDGHPRGGGQCGGSGAYDLLAARRTQSLVRYFKDIVGAKFPNFSHGYNYLGIQPEPNYDWAYEDYELDELCRGGGLLMNESIGNATSGPYSYIARNLQVEGDLVRERGGYYLGISYAMGPRDELVESALWAAAGCRPYNSGCTRETRRYCTRYAQYTFDENLRRLDHPEKVLSPVTETRLWWQPFVYETPLAEGRRQLVINLLNVPREETRTPEEAKNKPKYTMLPGTDPVALRLTLPEGLRATAVNLIDPYTLAVTPVPLAEGAFSVPAVAVWLVAVVDLEVAANAPSLASLYGPPKTFGVPRPNLKTERKPQVILDPKKEVWEVNRDLAELAPDGSRQAREQQAALEALPWAERNARVLAIRDRNPPENLIGGWWKGGTLPEDLKLKERKFEFGNLAPRRNARVDVFYGRGALDYRLRLPVVFAGLERFSVHDAPLAGSFRAGGGNYLVNGVGWRQYPAFDVLLYTAIPHCAMGPENCYGMVEYVKAGGGLFLTGGEYAFGKGGYNYTVLERELLPVLCVEVVDTRYSETPLAFQPGPDLAELQAPLDFGAKPSFWVWNQVALKPGVKVFLVAGNRPVLVGWQVGQGRVACLLVDHRGQSAPEVTAFFDWADWPALMRAVIAWLAPDALKTDEPPPPAVGPAEVKKLVAELEGAGLEDGLKELDQPGAGGLGDGAVGATRELSGEELKKRLAVISRALQATGPEVAAALAEQLATVSALPLDTRFAMLDFIRWQPPANLGALARRCLTAKESVIRGSGLQLLALAGDASFPRELTGPPPALETDAAGRARELALGLLWYGKPDLVEEGKRRVQAWNAVELKAKLNYTGGQEFSLAAPEGPLLDKETLFQRAAWLAYLSRYDAPAYGAQFAREWLMLSEYDDYCDRTLGNIWSDKQAADKVKQVKVEGIYQIRACFRRLRELSQPDVEALLKAQPDLLVAGLSKAHFTREFRAAMNLLGGLDRAATAPILTRLRQAANPDLAAFAAARVP